MATKPIRLTEIDRLARERFGENSVEVLRRVPLLGIAMFDLPKGPEPEPPTVVVPNYDVPDRFVGIGGTSVENVIVQRMPELYS